MKKLWRLLPFLLLFTLLIPTVAEASVDIVGIYYNFNAAGNEDALRIDYGGTKPTMHVRGDEFVILPQEDTVADVEARITERVMEPMIQSTPLSQLDGDYPQPLPPNAEIIKKNYVSYTCYFAIHIYSLTPVTVNGVTYQRMFITRFQNGFAGKIPDNWWPPPPEFE